LREANALERRSRAIATARLGLAVVGLSAVVGVLWWGWAAAGWATLGASVAVFVILVLAHASINNAAERASAALRFYERGIARLSHAWDRLSAASERFRQADHPFANDLDIVGHASLMQLVDATETAFGEENLARLLLLTDAGAWPEDVLRRQTAVRELTSRARFREELATAGGTLAGDRPDATTLIHWAEGDKPAASLAVPRTNAGSAGSESVDRLSGAVRALAWALPAAATLFIVVGPVLQVPSSWITVFVTAEIAIGLLFGVRLTPMLSAVSSRESAATRWREMFSLIEREPFEAPLLRELRARFAAGQKPASRELAALARIVGFVDARRNEVFRFLIGPFLFWDVHCASALLSWRVRAGAHLRGWIDALGEVEALASLGAFAFEHPSFVWPELATETTLVAQGLAHPLLPDDRRVGNDVNLPRVGQALVVTGSNMSGKSTLLRAIGVNVSLAYAGAPACATAFRIGPARVATSMRVEDSLEQGVSHFLAEVRRLKRVLDLAQESPRAPVLFLLDEILHGTNSRERVIGACAVVKQLLQRGAFGAVSTHDLGITALERELGGRVTNVHFEEQIVGNAMTFDYVLRPGIVHSSNALRLMRAIGIDVKDDA
jgi:ABC-type multidrug transport system fused ATPase/permease subunit